MIYKKITKLFLLFALFFVSCKMINLRPKHESNIIYSIYDKGIAYKYTDTTSKCVHIDTFRGLAVVNALITKTGKIKKIVLLDIFLYTKYDTLTYYFDDTSIYKYSKKEIKMIYRKIYPPLKRYIKHHIKFYISNGQGAYALMHVKIGCD